MTNDELFGYKAQLLNQIQYAEIAALKINENPNMSPQYLFFFIQSLLVALSNIAKLFEKNEKNEEKTKRALKLSQLFKINLSDFPITSEKALRNTSEHFDERIDSFIKKMKKEKKEYADCCVGTISENGESAGFNNPNAIYMRHYDNVNKNILYVGKDLNKVYKINIDDLLVEIIQLKSKVSWRYEI